MFLWIISFDDLNSAIVLVLDLEVTCLDFLQALLIWMVLPFKPIFWLILTAFLNFLPGWLRGWLSYFWIKLGWELLLSQLVLTTLLLHLLHLEKINGVCCLVVVAFDLINRDFSFLPRYLFLWWIKLIPVILDADCDIPALIDGSILWVGPLLAGLDILMLPGFPGSGIYTFVLLTFLRGDSLRLACYRVAFIVV